MRPGPHPHGGADDSERALAVVRLLDDMARAFQTALIVVTHDENLIPTFRPIHHTRDERTAGETADADSAACSHECETQLRILYAIGPQVGRVG